MPPLLYLNGTQLNQTVNSYKYLGVTIILLKFSHGYPCTSHHFATKLGNWWEYIGDFTSIQIPIATLLKLYLSIIRPHLTTNGC